VARLQGDIGDEIKRKEEPKIELYSKEDDLVYRDRIGKEDELSDSDGDEEGGKSTRRGGGVSKADYDKVVEAKNKAMQELEERMKKEVRAVEKRAEAERKRTEATLSELEAALKSKAEEEKKWGAVLSELEVASPEELRKLGEAHRRVMGELRERSERN
jgi:hypothetical protein